MQCDVLVASFDPTILRSTGIQIIQMLWANDISAELARDARSPEELLSKHRDENYSWIVIVKQDMLKVKSVGRRDAPDADIPARELLSWLRGEMRERDSRVVAKSRGVAHLQPEASASADKAHEQEVRVLVAQTKSKKFNRQTVVQQAQVTASKLVQSFLDGPIAAIETTDQVMDLIRGTALSEPESWRKVEHSVTTAEKKYVREVQDMLREWRNDWESSGGTRHAFVYNFRTGNCIYYDLGA
jgi:translation initiation factor 2-alpha kinase 4